MTLPTSSSRSRPALHGLSNILAGLIFTIILAGWLVPFIQFSSASQFDFWLAWLLCMLLLALPFTLLEIALAKRSQAVPLAGLPVLTREADSRPVWRVTGWLAIATLALLAGGLLYQAAAMGFGGMSDAAQPALQHLMRYLPFAMLLAGVGLSLLSRAVLLLVAGGAAMIALWLSFFNTGLPSWQWTAFSLREWGWAVTLALTTTGLGLGIYWQLHVNTTRVHASQSAVPIWLAQVAGGLMVAVTQGFHGKLALCLYSLALLAAGALLVNLLRAQLKARGVGELAGWLIIAAGLLVWLLPMQPVLVTLTVIMALLSGIGFAVFGGWQMKISHLRKSLNFAQESTYNLWRIAIRILVPLAVLLALAGLLWPVR